MSQPLNEQALLWSSVDSDGVVSVALSHMLGELTAAEGMRAGWLRAEDTAHLLQLLHANRLGLALWTMQDEAQLPQICQSLCEVRECSPETICLVYAEQLHWKLLSSLVEAGAQLIVRDVPGLQLRLPRAVACAPRSQRGLHPLTSGLVERLERHFASRQPESAGLAPK